MRKTALTLEERIEKVKQFIELVVDIPPKQALESVGLTYGQMYKITQTYPVLAECYARARVALVEKYVDESVEIADTEPNPLKARVRIETRQWIASKLIPKTYGDRLDLNVSHTVDVAGALSNAKARANIRTVNSPQLQSGNEADASDDAFAELLK